METQGFFFFITTLTRTLFFFLKRRTAFQVTPEKKIRGQGIKLSGIFPVNEPPQIGYQMYTSER